jgi:glycopeptide antibiotics resistance protein
MRDYGGCMIDPARNAVIAIVGGAFLFAVLFVPVVIIQSRRYGRLSPARMLGAAALSIYGVALFAYTLFPLPGNTARVCAPMLQPIPFHFVVDIARETAGESPLQVLTSGAVLQYVFNILLFVPWGIIVRRYFSRGLATAVLSGLALSLLIESTQYTAIWGLYNCAYRLGDVDDLIANTAGALVGALLAPLVLWWMPRQSELRPRRLEPRPVTRRRRWLGMLVDWVLVSLIGVAIGIPAVGVPRALGVPVPEWVDPLVSVLIPGIIVFLIPALRDSGATLGQRAVWLRPDWGNRPATVARRLARVSVGLVWVLLFTLGSLEPLQWVSSLAGLVVLAEVIAVGATRGQGIGARLARTTFVDSRTESQPTG